MIKGLTHDKDGVANKVTKYKGKIGTGWGPGEGPNKKKSPIATGYFMFMRSDTVDIKGSTKDFEVTKWLLDTQFQDALEKQNTLKGKNQNKKPRLMKIICYDATPELMWDSYLGKFKTDGLHCRSHGEGTVAKRLRFDSKGAREWYTQTCPYKECPDFINKECTPRGTLKLYPAINPTPPNPYRMDTTSINTIMALENGFNDIYNLAMTSHKCRCMIADEELPFDGLLLSELLLVHKKISSGGFEPFITEVYPTPGQRDIWMGPIKEIAVLRAKKVKLSGKAGNFSLTGEASQKFLDTSVERLEAPVETTENEHVMTDELTVGDEASLYEEFTGVPDNPDEDVTADIEISQKEVDDAKKKLLG